MSHSGVTWVGQVAGSVGEGQMKNRLVLALALAAICLFSAAIRRAESGPSVYVAAAVLWPDDKAQFLLSNGT